MIAAVAALGISSIRRSISPLVSHLSMQKQAMQHRLHQSPTMGQSSWFRPILVREEILKIVEEMDTQEVDNMNIRATEDLIEDLMAPLERQVLEAPAVVKTSGNTSLQHGL